MKICKVTCDKGDQLCHRTKPRQLSPFYGDNEYNCDVCDKNAEVRNGGFYACKYADKDCDFDCCPRCYNTEIVNNEESKDSKMESIGATS